MQRILFSLLLLFSLPTLGSIEYHWQVRQQSDDPSEIQTFVSEVEGEAIKAFKGIVQLPYSQAQIIAALTDFAAVPDWVYQCKEIQTGISDSDPLAMYLRFNGIWPVADRDVVVTGGASRDETTGTIHLYSRNAAIQFDAKGRSVRIPKLDNRWQLVPLANGWTEVHFQTFVNVGGLIPAWIANMVANDAPVKTLNGLRGLLESGNYDYHSIAEIPHLPPGEWR